MLQVRWASLIRLACVLLALAVLLFHAAIFAFCLQFLGFLSSVLGAYYLCIIAVEMLILALSFTAIAWKAGKLALVIPAAAVGYWWFVDGRGRSPIWSDFPLLVIAETCFAAAIFTRALLTRQYGANAQMGE